jgi:hypothetical protein
MRVGVNLHHGTQDARNSTNMARIEVSIEQS